MRNYELVRTASAFCGVLRYIAVGEYNRLVSSERGTVYAVIKGFLKGILQVKKGIRKYENLYLTWKPNTNTEKTLLLSTVGFLTITRCIFTIQTNACEETQLYNNLL